LTGYWAFIPAVPPPKITYDSTLALLLSQADSALSELSGLGRVVPNPDLLIAPYVKREAVASSRIEGTQADLSDLLLDEIQPKRTPPGSDVYEIRNYVAALRRSYSRISYFRLRSTDCSNSHLMNEAETRAEHIDPALKAAGWGVVEGSKVLREYPITLGRLGGELFDACARGYNNGLP
jgi:Fic family protein